MVWLFRRKLELVPTEDQKRIFEILLRRLHDGSGKYDVEAVWVISKLANVLNCGDRIIEKEEETERKIQADSTTGTSRAD